MRKSLAVPIVLIALAALLAPDPAPVLARGTGGGREPGTPGQPGGSRTRVAPGGRTPPAGRSPRRGAPRREVREAPSSSRAGTSRSAGGGTSRAQRREDPNRRPPRRPDLPARRAVRARHETALQGSPRVRFQETRTLADGTVVTKTTVPGGVRPQPEGSRTQALRDRVLTNNEILAGEMVRDAIRTAEALRKLKGKEKVR